MTTSGVFQHLASIGKLFDIGANTFIINPLIPLARMADNTEYKAAIQFLCSEASSYLNGQNIVMDGGRSVW